MVWVPVFIYGGNVDSMNQEVIIKAILKRLLACDYDNHEAYNNDVLDLYNLVNDRLGLNMEILHEQQ